MFMVYDHFIKHFLSIRLFKKRQKNHLYKPMGSIPSETRSQLFIKNNDARQYTPTKNDIEKLINDNEVIDINVFKYDLLLLESKHQSLLRKKKIRGKKNQKRYFIFIVSVVLLLSLIFVFLFFFDFSHI
jgi:hypothetical protein